MKPQEHLMKLHTYWTAPGIPRLKEDDEHYGMVEALRIGAEAIQDAEELGEMHRKAIEAYDALLAEVERLNEWETRSVASMDAACAAVGVECCDEIPEAVEHMRQRIKELKAELSREHICGLCGMPGADKCPHPNHWPGERVPNSEFVHAECETAETARAHAAFTDEQRERFLHNM